MNRMDSKVCVIAGATQGLGAAIARRLAAAGAAGIVVTGRNAERGTAVAEGITATFRVPALFVRGDLASVEECRASRQAIWPRRCACQCRSIDGTRHDSRHHA